MTAPKDKIRLRCDNPLCINKSVVYRKYNGIKAHICNLCKCLMQPADKRALRKISTKVSSEA